MSENSSKEKSLAATPKDIIDVNVGESSIEIDHRVYTKATSKETKSDLETENKDENERKSRKRSRGDDDKKGDREQNNPFDVLLSNTDFRELLLAKNASQTERNAIWKELGETQRILIRRQERVRDLEMQFRVFHERRFTLPPERMFAEKVIREEEIVESRRLVSLQLKRCHHLQSLFKANNREMIDLERALSEKEQSLLQGGLVKIGKGAWKEMEEKVMNEEKPEKDATPGKAKAIDYIDNKTEITRNISSQNGIIRQREIQEQNDKLKRAFDEHLAVAAEMKRRANAQSLEQRVAMEQQAQDQEAICNAKIRQALTKQSIEARKYHLMTQEDLPQKLTATLCQETHKAPGYFRQIFRMPPVSKSDSSDVPNPAVDANEREEIIVIDDDGDDDKKLLPSEAKFNEDVAATTTTTAAAKEEDEDDNDDEDEDFIVI